ncbi:MAG: hypothetical protein ACO3EH_00345 [Ilumatobacteraceae bacterium]
MLMPQEITDKVNLKYKTEYATTQIRRLINTRGWSARRKVIVEKAGIIEAKKDTAIVRELTKAHAKVMDDVARGTSQGLERAVEMVQRAGDARSLSAAASALKSLYTTWRVASGIDNSNTARGAATFSFNFANVDLRAAPQPVAAMPVEPLSLDDEDASEE